MTRSWQFALPAAQWYTLWNLITTDASFTDPTFSNAQFVPSRVAELSIYATTDNINVSEDVNDEVGILVTAAGVPYTKGPYTGNIVDLKSINVKPSTTSGVVNVSITSF